MKINQARLMARNLFTKYTGITKHEAQRIIDQTEDDSIRNLCAMQPEQAAATVKQHYGKVLQLMGDAARNAELKQITPEISDERRNETGVNGGLDGHAGGDAGSNDDGREPVDGASLGDAAIPRIRSGDTNPLDAGTEGGDAESSDAGSAGTDSGADEESTDQDGDTEVGSDEQAD